MTFDRYVEWLARGRAHQTEGNVIDALLCYRRALREVSGGVDARFHVGEIAWHLANPTDAIAAWEAAIRHSPKHLPSLHALANAYAATGRFDASLQAADRILALRSRGRRVNALATMSRAAIGETIDDARLTEAVAAKADWPLTLLSAVSERLLSGGRHGDYRGALPKLLDAAAGASVTASTADALRVVALALARAGESERAEAFADQYAMSCQALHRPRVPLLWPLRSAGGAIRAGILVTGEQVADAESLVSGMARRLASRCRWTALVLPGTGAPRASEAFDRRVLPPEPDARPAGCAR